MSVEIEINFNIIYITNLGLPCSHLMAIFLYKNWNLTEKVTEFIDFRWKVREHIDHPKIF